MKHRIKVRKDPYSSPSWVVSYGSIRIGNAHSQIVAQTAARFAGGSVMDISAENICANYLIMSVSSAMAEHPLGQYWTSAAVPDRIPHAQVHARAA